MQIRRTEQQLDRVGLRRTVRNCAAVMRHFTVRSLFVNIYICRTLLRTREQSQVGGWRGWGGMNQTVTMNEVQITATNKKICPGEQQVRSE